MAKSDSSLPQATDPPAADLRVQPCAEVCRHRLAAYQEARRILASNFTSVPERRAAIFVRDEFLRDMPALMDALLRQLDAGGTNA